MKNDQRKNITDEAQDLIDYIRETHKDSGLALSVLDSIMRNSKYEFNQKEWSAAEFIGARTSYISVERNYDVDFEAGDFGVPTIVGGRGSPFGVSILEQDNLTMLRQEVDDILNKTTEKISTFLSRSDRPKWKCLKCDRFLQKELSSLEEVQELLRDFSIGKYRKCRSCSTLNYFDFDSVEIRFKTA